MDTLLLALSIPVLVCAVGLYAIADGMWRRRHPRPLPPALQALRDEIQIQLAAEQAAEQILTDAYRRYGALYEPPTRETSP